MFDLNVKHRHWFKLNDMVLPILAMIYVLIMAFAALVFYAEMFGGGAAQ